MSWTEARSGTMPTARAIQYIDLGVPSARYVRLTVLDTWGSPTITAFYNKLAIDELYVVGGFVKG